MSINKADVIVHWSTGPVHCCLEHADGLLKIGKLLGAHTPVEPYSGDELCSNCENEAKNVNK